MILNWLKKRLSPSGSAKPRIVPRSAHPISREDICGHALKVLYRLHNHGYEAYLVGGGVRDLLLGVPPKDFDVVTNATPEQIRALFRNCRLIGRRFRLAHIHFGRDIIEVATFRASHHPEHEKDTAHQSEDGMLLRDNVYGTNLEDDVYRRDFTVNALYYNIADYSIVDYVGGLQDIKNRTLRLIGAPDVRYAEDPVRMLRALRFSAQKKLVLSPDAAAAIDALAPTIQQAAPARLYEELPKLFLKGSAQQTFDALFESVLFAHLFPELSQTLAQSPESVKLIQAVLRSTDERIARHKPVTLAFILVGLFWPVVASHCGPLQGKGWYPKLMQAIQNTFKTQSQVIQIPKRLQLICAEIWIMQFRLLRPQPKRIDQLLQERRFRATYDFLCLRAEYEPALKRMADWWTKYQQSDANGQGQLRQMLKNPKSRRTKRKPS